MTRVPFPTLRETSPFISDNFASKKFIIPGSANLVIFGPDLRDFLKTRFTFPKELANWIDDNLISEHGQYLIILGQDADVAVILRSAKKIDLDRLKNIPTAEGQQPVYKEESQENITFHLLNLPPDENDQRKTFTFFQIGEWSFFVSSNAAARILASVQKLKNPVFELPKLPPDTSMAVFFRNGNQPLGPNFYDLLFGQKKKNPQVFEKVTKFEFILKANKFSGLMMLK